MSPSFPKPAARVKAVRKPLKRGSPLKAGKPLAKSTEPLKKAGTTKAKKVARYAAYLRSAAWKLIRQDALDRASYRCEYVEQWGFPFTEFGTKRFIRCAAREGLQIHHKTYARMGGRELPEDLIVYCQQHHAEIEARDFPHRQRNR